MLPSSTPILRFDRLVHRAGGRAILDTQAGERTLQRSESALCVGPSGAGKSTLLSLLAGLTLPSEGAIEIGGTSWASLTEAARDQHRAQHVGYLPQREHLVPTINVLDNVLLPAYFLHRNISTTQRERAHALLKNLDVETCANQAPRTLSRGQSQRVCLARALINAPALLLADEPTANLDDESANRVLKLLTEHARTANAALVIATHDARIARFVPTPQLWTLNPC
jgi:putative ABC transport system ATP-binding protein